MHLARKHQAADASERVLQQRGLRVELRRVADVLPRAASTAAEDRTHGIGPYGAGGEQLLHASAREPLLQVHHADPHPVARRRVGHEDHPAVGCASHTVASGGQRTDLELEGDPRGAHTLVGWPRGPTFANAMPKLTQPPGVARDASSSRPRLAFLP
jgi:hypothetical protein